MRTPTRVNSSIEFWSEVKSLSGGGEFELQFRQISRDFKLIYFCFKRRSKRARQSGTCRDTFLFTVFDAGSGKQKYTFERELDSLGGFLLDPFSPTTLFLIQKNKYLKVNLLQGLNQVESLFEEVNCILQASISVNGRYLVEVRQFEGVQIWDVLLQNKIYVNTDERFNSIFENPKSAPEELGDPLQRVQREKRSQVRIEFMEFKDGKQSILV